MWKLSASYGLTFLHATRSKSVSLAAAIDVGALQGASLTLTIRSSTSASSYLAQKQNKEAAIVKRQDETLMSME
jgi:hypothetical protein